MSVRWRRQGILPGFGLTLGYSTTYVSLLVVLPLMALVARAASLGVGELWRIATDARAIAAYRVSFGTALAGATVNLVFGVVVAWVLVRYDFRGRGLVNGLIDLPFALPTAVAGVCLTAVYSSDGPIGSLVEPYGLRVAFSPLGIAVALTFVGLPFVVRTVQPVLEELDEEVEEAAATLGATGWQTFACVLLPALLPAALTGFALALARALGEYGSVVFISGNMPMKTEVAPVLIVAKLEQYDYGGATALAAVMLGASFALLLSVNLVQRWTRRGAE